MKHKMTRTLAALAVAVSSLVAAPPVQAAPETRVTADASALTLPGECFTVYRAIDFTGIYENRDAEFNPGTWSRIQKGQRVLGPIGARDARWTEISYIEDGLDNWVPISPNDWDHDFGRTVMLKPSGELCRYPILGGSQWRWGTS